MKIKILFNASTNVVGGGIKNAAFFIKKSIALLNYEWYYAISPQVLEILNSWGVEIPKDKLIVFDLSPARSSKSRQILLDFVSKNSIELVYTMAGPAYVKFPCNHLQGISNPYITHADWSAFKLKGNLLSIAKYYVYVFIQFFFSKNADYFVFQTEFSKNSFQRRSKIASSRLFVVPNAFDTSIKDFFINEPSLEKLLGKSEIRIFCPGAAYIHKGFQFIPTIINELKKITNKEFKFILTLPTNSELWLEIHNQLEDLKLVQLVENIGPFNYANIKTLLADSDIVFVPSLLETFSASYLEAMCAQKKLVVADKLYAREVCGDYAIYVDPMDSKSTAQIFQKLFTDYEISVEEIFLGDAILKHYGSQDERFEKLVTVISNILTK